jgi:CarD family transcriptional regulator
MNTIPFVVGENVVYPNHGVGVIEHISSRTIGDSVERFYLLCIRSSNLKVTIPFQNVATVGLRRIAQNAEAQKILEFLSEGECESSSDWKNRFRDNSDRMRTGSLLEIAIVLKGLLILAAQKSLSAREKKMLETARFLLITEMAIARGVEEDAVKEELHNALCQCKLRWPEPESIDV